MDVVRLAGEESVAVEVNSALPKGANMVADAFGHSRDQCRTWFGKPRAQSGNVHNRDPCGNVALHPMWRT
jgi:hypothetical protein